MGPSIPSDGKISCPTPRNLVEELDNLTYALQPEEKEDTWENFEKAILRFSAVTRGGGYKHREPFVEGVGRGGVGGKLVRCLLSDRGRLSGATTDLLQTFAPRLATYFKPLIPIYLEPLLTLLGRPNKVIIRRAEKCLITIILYCPLPQLLTWLKIGLSDNATSCRKGSAGGIERALSDWPEELWTDKWLNILEDCMKKMAADRDAEVRKIAKKIWEIFADRWSERIDEFSTQLSPTIKRYLDIPRNNAGSSKLRDHAGHAVVRKMPPLNDPDTATGNQKPLRNATHKTNADLICRPFPAQDIFNAKHLSSADTGSEPFHPCTTASEYIFSKDQKGISLNSHSVSTLSAAAINLGQSRAVNPKPPSLSKPIRPILNSQWSDQVQKEITEKPRRMAPPERIRRPLAEEENSTLLLVEKASSKGHGRLKPAARLPITGSNRTASNPGRGTANLKEPVTVSLLRSITSHPSSLPQAMPLEPMDTLSQFRQEVYPKEKSTVADDTEMERRKEQEEILLLARSVALPESPRSDNHENRNQHVDRIIKENSQDSTEMPGDKAEELVEALSTLKLHCSTKAPDDYDASLEEKTTMTHQSSSNNTLATSPHSSRSAAFVKQASKPMTIVNTKFEPKLVLAKKPPVPKAKSTKPPVPIVRKTFKPTSMTNSTIHSIPHERKGAIQGELKATATSGTISKNSKSRKLSSEQAPTTKTMGTFGTQSIAKTIVSKSPKIKINAAPTEIRAVKSVTTSKSVPLRFAASGSKAALSKDLPTSNSALPPIRKEKIRLKAALPSFRPVRKMIVQPQNIPLPESPQKPS
ncbi:hypothetical protein L204_103569 [Cryptococcus depauperatus]|nr:hypothetical protein L204_01884 [Cryptococcus depauperatus CBS 7855]